MRAGRLAISSKVVHAGKKVSISKMQLPWTKSCFALICAAAEDRRFHFILCCLAAAGTVSFSFVNPQIIRYTIDSVIGSAPFDAPPLVLRLIDALGGAAALRQNLWICALFIIAAAVCSGGFNIVRKYTCMEIGETAAWRLRNTLYGHIQRLPYDWHVSCQTGDIIQRCTSDVDTIRNFIQNQFGELLRIFCVFTIALIMMFSMDIVMTLVALALVPVIVLFSIVYFRRVAERFAKADAAEGAMQARAQENYTGVRVVRAFGREAFEVERFSEKTKAYADIWLHIGKMLGLFWGAGDLMSGLQLAIVVGAGIYRSAHGDLSPGTFLAFYTYCNWMIWPVRQLGRILSDLSKTMVAAGRVREVLQAEPETDDPGSLSPVIRGELRFDTVSFAYGNNEPVLRDISFTVKPGETLAILGGTGSGKSSLVHLLSRLYDIGEHSGCISIDGVDIRRIARRHLRRRVGLCLQEPFLFSRTIKENIAVHGETIEEVRSAASTAQVEAAVGEFADGYDTMIGERGVTLSGGQKQRVAIARMLAANPPVMIFDDSLSAVDTETDAKIRAGLRGRVKDAAVIIISHRISSLMQADQILVLKDGTVEELGSHAELMARNGTYRRIFDLQSGNGAEYPDA
jgi:ATP-binding cassette subfamily B protein